MKVHSDIDGLDFKAMKAVMRHKADEFELTIVEDGPKTLMIETEFGQFGVAARQGAGLRLIVSAVKPDDLHVLRDALVGQIAEGLPAVAEEIVWSDTLEADQYPPNLHSPKWLRRASSALSFNA